jgi:hypothetical protein
MSAVRGVRVPSNGASRTDGLSASGESPPPEMTTQSGATGETVFALP